MTRWRHHWRAGREAGIPVCCIVRWLVGRGEQTVARGKRFNARGSFVPCGVLHRAEVRW